MLGQYLRGQLLVMLIMAAFYAIGLAFFGLDLALPIGIFTGLAMFIPYLGFGIGLILAVLAGLLQFASVKALVMVGIVFGIGQVVEGFFLTPRLVGEQGKNHRQRMQANALADQPRCQHQTLNHLAYAINHSHHDQCLDRRELQQAGQHSQYQTDTEA